MTKEELEKENKELRDNYELFKAVAEPEIAALKNEIVNLKGVIKSLSEQRDALEQEKCELLGIIQGKDKAIFDSKKENTVLKKALNLYVNWTDECGIGWDNFPDMTEKWYKIAEEKGLGWIDGLMFMVIEEAKEQLAKEVKE